MRFYKFSNHAMEEWDTLFMIAVDRNYEGQIGFQFVIWGYCLGVTL